MAEPTEEENSEDSTACAKIALPIEVRAEIEAVWRIINGLKIRLDKLRELTDDE